MKLSFSIQYWDGLSWDDFCAAAVSARMQGIDIRDLQGPVFSGKGSPTNPERAASVQALPSGTSTIHGWSLSMPEQR